MARIDTLSNFLTDVADSIREKTGNTEPIACEDFDTEIESISGGGSANLQTKSVTITENGTTSVTPDTGYDGLSSVSVTTSVPTSSLPDYGFVVNEWTNGYPKIIQIVGFTQLISSYFGNNNVWSYTEQIILPNNFVILGSAFSNMSKLKTINTSLLTQLNENAFQNCSSLQTVTLPEGLNATTSRFNNSIFSQTFKYCSSLDNITIPSNVIRLGYECFRDCGNLKTLNCGSIREIGPDIMANGGGSSNGYVFYNCSNLEIDELPSNLTTIRGNYNFANCRKITISKIPDGVLTIPAYTFNNCTGITDLDINNVTKIDIQAFSGCSNLNIDNLKNVTTLGAVAFLGCDNHSLITIPDGITVLNSNTFNKNKMPQISMNNVTTIYSSTNSSVFMAAPNIVAFWIGSAITNNGLGRYSLLSSNVANYKRIYIDLPRATVEAFTNYQYAFCNNASMTTIIVCNDDSGFITKTQFDAIDWSTYTP